jgi:amidase
MHAFMERYEFLILAVNQVPPFPVETEYPTEINGVQMETYIDWMKSCYYITVTGHPAISVPCGFTPEGLPVGVQIVGRYRDEYGVLQLAHAFEQATGVGRRRPPIVEQAAVTPSL